MVCAAQTGQVGHDWSRSALLSGNRSTMAGYSVELSLLYFTATLGEAGLIFINLSTQYQKITIHTLGLSVVIFCFYWFLIYI